MPPELRVAKIVEEADVDWQAALQLAVSKKKLKNKEIKFLNFFKQENRARQLRFGLIYAAQFATNAAKYRALIAERCMFTYYPFFLFMYTTEVLV